MTYMKVATAAASLLMLAGTAIAQMPPAGTPPFASDDEKAMYETNREAMSGFFTDETMATLKSEAEAKEYFAKLGLETQGQIKAACERAASNRGQYGTITATVCAQAGVKM